MKITVEMLRAKKACGNQVAVFAKLWPHGATVNKRNIAIAMQHGLDINWAAQYLLPAPLWQQYNDAEAPLRQQYEVSIAKVFLRLVKEAEK